MLTILTLLSDVASFLVFEGDGKGGWDEGSVDGKGGWGDDPTTDGKAGW